MTVRRRVVAHGRVQGVFFRDTCRRVAMAEGVSGWVRNRPDGTVEAVFEGGKASVDHMVAWCHRGPRSAVVTLVEVTEEPVQNAAGFGVR